VEGRGRWEGEEGRRGGGDNRMRGAEGNERLVEGVS